MSEYFNQLAVALQDRYQLEFELGRGGMATVFLAQDRLHQRRVAIKVLHPEFAGAVGQERFLREIRIAAELNHPHILPLLDAGSATLGSASLPYYVMPYVDGESLRTKLLRERQLAVDTTIEIAADIASALTYAHARGVVHRDIKPENILFSGHEAVVADFGIARAINRAAESDIITSAGLAVGTPAYMSPEQAAGDTEVDGRSDIYSLGCVLYEMLGGEPPFTGPSANAILARHRVDPVPSLTTIRPTVPPHVEAAVRRSLEKLPVDRFASAEELTHALAQSWTPERKQPRWPWIAGGLALTVAVAALLWGRIPGRGDPAVSVTRASRLAVAYLQDLTPGNALEDVANGFTEDLTDALGSVSGLSVISSEAMKPYRHQMVGPDSLGRALEIGTLVSGTVDSGEGTLRVRVRLVDTETGEQLETIPLSRPWSDLLSVREDMVTEVTRLLRTRLGTEIRFREFRSETRNLAAWEMLQRAERIWDEARAMTASGPIYAILLRADSTLALAGQKDRRWAAPWVERAWLHLTLFRMGDNELPPGSVQSRPNYLASGLEHAARALELQPDDPRALEVRGALRYEEAITGGGGSIDSLIRLADEDLRRAVERDPQRARAWSTLSLLLLYEGRFEEADAAARQALQADAFLTNASEVMILLFFSALNREKFTEANEWCETGQRRFVRDYRFDECRLILLARTGRESRQVREAWQEAANIQTRSINQFVKSRWPNHHLMAAMVAARAGLQDSARAVIEAVNRQLPTPASAEDIAYDEAYVWLLLGDRVRALERLRYYIATHPEDRTYLGESPWFRSLRGDPVFDSLTSDSVRR